MGWLRGQAIGRLISTLRRLRWLTYAPASLALLRADPEIVPNALFGFFGKCVNCHNGGTMAEQLPGGPYWHVDLGNGRTAPWYILPFDKDGICTAPLTYGNIVSDVGSGRFTDVFLFSHGWNNDWEAASARYHRFVDGYVKMRRDYGLSVPDGYMPLLIGVFWPSTALVMPWERGPKFAGADDSIARHATAIDQEVREIDTIAEALAPERRREFYALARKGATLTQAEAEQLAELVLPIYNGGAHAEVETPGEDVQAPVTSADVLKAWMTAAAEDAAPQAGRTADKDGYTDPVAGPPELKEASLRSAGFLDKLDPRKIVRTLTVYQMKDRAGVIGSRGVAPLLARFREAANVRVHLIGHSYGAKVVLSALCNGDVARPVHSVLLLQPAVNGWCFAGNVDGTGRAGGYHQALARTQLPIMTTYSRNDSPLTKFFHVAVRRPSDLGELRIAAGPQAPSKFAALGGFGPQGLGTACRFETMRSAPDGYDFSSGVRVIALNGDEAIESHGAVEVPETFWCLYNQVRQA